MSRNGTNFPVSLRSGRQIARRPRYIKSLSDLSCGWNRRKKSTRTKRKRRLLHPSNCAFDFARARPLFLSPLSDCAPDWMDAGRATSASLRLSGLSRRKLWNSRRRWRKKERKRGKRTGKRRGESNRYDVSSCTYRTIVAQFDSLNGAIETLQFRARWWRWQEQEEGERKGRNRGLFIKWKWTPP